MSTLRYKNGASVYFYFKLDLVSNLTICDDNYDNLIVFVFLPFLLDILFCGKKYNNIKQVWNNISKLHHFDFGGTIPLTKTED